MIFCDVCIRKILDEFNFPIYRDGKEVRKILWESGNTVETVCLLSKVKE